MAYDISQEIRDRQSQTYQLYDEVMNSQFVKVLKTIGFDQTYVRAEGSYLFNGQGERYLDLLSGYGVFAVGRNHPGVIQTLKTILDAQLPNLVQMDCPLLAALLAEKLLEYCPPEIDKAFFTNSGAEAVEAAIKFARAATKRSGVVYCDHAFHGLTYGALSLNGDEIFRKGLGPLLEDTHKVPFNDIGALEKLLRKKKIACFIVEPVQGKGIYIAEDGYLAEAQRLCRKYGTLLVVDEIQSGMGRTGKFFAFEHWGIEPDIITVAKALSGGFIPVGAVLTRKDIFNKLFDRMDRAVIHGSTFGKNNLAMAAGLATLEILKEENLIENARIQGEALKKRLGAFVDKYDFVKGVRGKGLMVGLEFGPPKSLSLKPWWMMLDKANRGLYCQLVIIPMFKKHKIISQVAGHGSYVLKMIPPLVLTEADVDWVINAMDDVIADAHKFPGAAWDLAKTLAGHALGNKAA